MDDSLLVSRLGKQLLIARRQQRSCSTRRKVRGPMATALPKFPDCCSWCAACSSEVPFTGSIGTASLRGCAAVFGRFCTGARFSPDRSEMHRSDLRCVKRKGRFKQQRGPLATAVVLASFSRRLQRVLRRPWPPQSGKCCGNRCSIWRVRSCAGAMHRTVLAGLVRKPCPS